MVDILLKDIYGVKQTYTGVDKINIETVNGGTAIFKLSTVIGEPTVSTGVYGVSWNYGSDSTKLTRLGDAAEYPDPVPATTLTEAGSSPFDNISPWADMKPYNIVNGEVSYSTDSSDFSMATNDTVVYIPKFYYKVVEDTANSTISWYISATESDGFSLHPGSGRYVSRYHTGSVDSTYCTRSGVAPVTDKTRATMRTNSHNKGANWWMLDFATWSAIQLLYLVEFADWNSQSVLGYGQNGGEATVIGSTDTAVYHTVKRSSDSNQYRWIEDPYSTVYDWVDGFVLSSDDVYLGLDNSSFSDTTTGLTNTGVEISKSGYISKLSINETYPWAFLPAATAGTNGTHIPDYVYSENSSAVLYVGGRNTYLERFGLFCLGLDYGSSSDGGGYVGSRLIYIPTT